MPHVCRSAWLYLVAAVAVAGVAVADDVVGGTLNPTTITTPAMQGLLGWLILSELGRWRELATAVVSDLREGRLRVLHEHVDVDGTPVERRRPTRTKRGDVE